MPPSVANPFPFWFSMEDAHDWQQQDEYAHRRWVEEYAMTEATKLAIWEQVEKTDPSYTKPFNRGGGFKGTATNATYLAKRATEVFGPMGLGWGLDILDESLMEGAPLDDRGTRELIHKVRVKLWYRYQEQRGEVVQFGQTTFVGKNRHGLFTDEEAPKKSLTDGMSKCLSLLGFSADIHLGRYDDNKYVQEITAEFREKQEAEARKAAPKVDEAQLKELQQLLKETQTDAKKFHRFFKVASLKELPEADFDRAKRMLVKKKETAT
ncbi:hypothetical protein CAI21_21830 [Alkalilimnicola ehrlichii]|uniref:Uncharacterized protein n=1 Tax=Alkalilimnicola ehrlichii TaxID=351052 RepID=A0A3E0WHY3_9GAMM|nr:hypothetical protein [Alkalilimnicola ehrlichii]RFA24383.1 hypothetical protein CAI21_21830 [Alkalilimnicola ehrlichii]RFA31576.1 hypothetical protein CAL65_22165 [Alkalilimnicola ehrlichii]